MGGVRFGIDKNGNCGYYNSNNEFIAFNKKTQTINTSLNGSVNPWVFTFDELKTIDYVKIEYSNTGINNSFDSKTNPSYFTISGNTVKFSHGTDTINWTVTCTATGYN